ncbi:hypothetical protein, partial [Serratia fonticola]|uniref:hypothetical protein n=1 Tax=Serratia fonticola TaxID=47917 RepID=UPI003B9EB85F
FFALFPNFDRLEPKSKTYGIIGSALRVSFGKNRTYRPYCFTITDDLAKNSLYRINKHAPEGR